MPAAAKDSALSPWGSKEAGMDEGMRAATISRRPSLAAAINGVRPSMDREKALPGDRAISRETRLGLF